MSESKALYEGWFIPKGEELVFKKAPLLPKGWVLSDYSSTENLIEIEDTKDGHRFWPGIKDLFRAYPDFGFNQEIRVHGNNINTILYNVKLLRFETETFRKREYLIAVFERVIERENTTTEIKIDDKTLPNDNQLVFWTNYQREMRSGYYLADGQVFYKGDDMGELLYDHAWNVEWWMPSSPGQTPPEISTGDKNRDEEIKIKLLHYRIHLAEQELKFAWDAMENYKNEPQ